MWELIITKLFCHHKWVTHSKENNFAEEQSISSMFRNGIQSERFKTVEILICTECGKIKILKY